jgi:hypothetical protein
MSFRAHHRPTRPRPTLPIAISQSTLQTALLQAKNPKEFFEEYPQVTSYRQVNRSLFLRRSSDFSPRAAYLEEQLVCSAPVTRGDKINGNVRTFRQYFCNSQVHSKKYWKRNWKCYRYVCTYTVQYHWANSGFWFFFF